MRLCIILLMLLYIGCSYNEQTIKIYDLTTEYLKNPIGIDKPQPKFSWKLKASENNTYQYAYQILVSTNSLNWKNSLVWDSGKKTSSNTLNVKYQGKPLKSNEKYYWKVKVWRNKKEAAIFSKTSFFQTGMLSEDDWKGNWISNKFCNVSNKREPFSKYDDSRPFTSEDTSAVYLQKEFVTRQIKKATAYISGLGYYEMFLNGARIENHVLNPVFTDYQKKIKYNAFDVTHSIKINKNIIGVILGNGFYNHQERDLFQMEKSNWKTPPKLLFELHLEYNDGSIKKIVSDESWKWSYGPIVYNSIRGGETIDARIDFSNWTMNDFNTKNWAHVKTVPSPIGKITYQYMPPLRETKRFSPINSWQVGKDTTIFDFGENITGYAKIKISGSKGKLVNIQFNEILRKDSTLNIKNSSGHTWGRFQHGKLILSGKKSDIFKPRFTYHGFRYVQITGAPKDSIKNIEALSVHTDLKSIGTFESSNERLNELNSAVRRTLLNSVHSMPGEEPTREKMGWTFDAGMVTMESYLMNFNAINTYKKYLQDLIDSQEENGHIPPIVPTNGWGLLEKTEKGNDTIIRYDDPWWGGTIAFVAEELFRFTGDTTIIENSFEAIKKYSDFVRSTAKNDIVYWSLGDWLDLKHNQKGWGPGLTPVEQTSTAASFYLCNIVAKHAEILGKPEIYNSYKNHANRIKNSFNKNFLDQKTGWYAKNSQTAQALPLFLDLVPKNVENQVEKRLLEAIESNDYHTSVGFVGVIPLLKYLSENGHRDIIYKMLIQEKSPGWLHFVHDDKSTMGENLNSEGYGTSHHPFASNIGFYLYYYLGGISPHFTTKTDFNITPGLDTELQWAKTSYKSLKGTVSVHWEKSGNATDLTITIPTNCKAKVKLPKSFKIIKPLLPSSIECENWNEVILTSGFHEIALQKQKGVIKFQSTNKKMDTFVKYKLCTPTPPTGLQ
ncbi:alpha-L-rhamnosidase [Galbibacter mesophilus]|uniref:alpha-L-rhamnosidase n=1 Tax=Galbibacter mesophilus TaxID=379069 RepID=UPI00191EC5C8|nr:alpha-L-rhamnosidase [Galbibacter mesophilus]MCM5663863.1 glycoside hydrolase family 78 protein [Galbibacter mesophilus]